MILLVTGGAGFIGSHLCKRLVKEGHQVVAIDNLSNGSLENLKGLEESPKFTFCEFDVNNTIKLRTVFDKHPFDMVFHLAANADVNKGEESAIIDIENTLQTTLSVLEMMRIYEIKKFFFASSSTVYGNAEERLQEHRSIMRPISHYGAAKLASEAFVSSYSSLHDFQVWIARFCNAVGPNMAHGVIPDLIKRLKSHPETLEVYGDGTSKPQNSVPQQTNTNQNMVNTTVTNNNPSIQQPTPVVDPTPQVNNQPVTEINQTPTPVVEQTPVVEPTPVAEQTPVVNNEPVAENNQTPTTVQEMTMEQMYPQEINNTNNNQTN